MQPWVAFRRRISDGEVDNLFSSPLPNGEPALNFKGDIRKDQSLVVTRLYNLHHPRNAVPSCALGSHYRSS